MQMNLIDTFAPNFKGHATRTAMHFGDASYTFGDLDRLSDAVAAGLAGLGVGHGDRVAMYLANSAPLVLYYLASLKLGAIVVPMNLLYRDRELRHLLGDAEPTVILTDAERYDVLAPLLAEFPALQHVVMADGAATAETLPFSALLDATGPMPTTDVRGHDGALMIYTSGTTGKAKGALLSHSALVSNIVALVHCWQWTRDDRFLLTLPMFHLHGLGNGLHGALTSGCETFIEPRFYADAALDRLNDKQCTIFFGVPTMYERLLEQVAAGGQVPSGMRLFVSGSAPLAPETFARFEAVFGHRILERYGMSETAMITSNCYPPEGRIQGTVGKPLPGVDLQMRGPNLLTAYWRQPEKTAESFVDGWFRTGDLGRWDAHGHVTICGRAKELIISGGFNVYPQEVINCLVEHDAVATAAVIGVPDQRRGELVKAYVVAEQPVAADDLIAYCREHLASFKVPRSIVFLDALPRNAMGKLQLNELPERDVL
jgi:malonyl-CoA/methylmalonyl-CoA synthetase